MTRTRGKAGGVPGFEDAFVADPNRALVGSVVRLLAPVLDELVFVGRTIAPKLSPLLPQRWRPRERRTFVRRLPLKTQARSMGGAGNGA